MSAAHSYAVLARTATLAVALTLTAAACGGSDEGTATTDAAPTTDAGTADTTEAQASESTPAPTNTATTPAPVDKTGTTAASTGDGSTSVEGAILWTSEDGRASMEVSPDWTARTLGPLTTWSINDPDVPDASLNIMVASVDGSSQDWLDAISIVALPRSEVIDSGVMKAPDGTEIGYLETKGESQTNPGVEEHSYVTFNVANGYVAQATFTAPEANWPGTSDKVRPYLETIKSI